MMTCFVNKHQVYLLLQFAGPDELTMGSQIVAGPTNTVIIDKQRMYWMAGKVRTRIVGSRFTC